MDVAFVVAQTVQVVVLVIVASAVEVVLLLVSHSKDSSGGSSSCRGISGNETDTAKCHYFNIAIATVTYMLCISNGVRACVCGCVHFPPSDCEQHVCAYMCAVCLISCMCACYVGWWREHPLVSLLAN